MTPVFCSSKEEADLDEISTKNNRLEKKSACCIKQNGWMFFRMCFMYEQTATAGNFQVRFSEPERPSLGRPVDGSWSDSFFEYRLLRLVCWVIAFPPGWSSLIATFQSSAKLGLRVLQSYQLLPTLPEIEVS